MQRKFLGLLEGGQFGEYLSPIGSQSSEFVRRDWENIAG